MNSNTPDPEPVTPHGECGSDWHYADRPHCHGADCWNPVIVNERFDSV